MKKNLLCICAAVLFLSACKKTEESVVTNNPTVTSIQSMISKNAPAVQKFTFNNETGTQITGAKGTIIKIAPNTYGSFTGQVSISLKEVYNKKEMLGAGIFTAANGSRMLSSLGMFEVKATRNGAEVLPEKEADITMNNTSGATPENTKVFKLLRVQDSSSGVLRDEWVEYDKNWDLDSAKNFCKFKFKCLSWCNLDAYVANSGVNSTIRITPPAGFGSTNTQVYFNLNGVNGLVTLYPNIVDKTFNTYSLQSGLSGTVIMVAVKDDKYYKKVINVTFTNQSQLITVTSMDAASFSEMETLLGSL